MLEGFVLGIRQHVRVNVLNHDLITLRRCCKFHPTWSAWMSLVVRLAPKISEATSLALCPTGQERPVRLTFHRIM